MSIQQLTLDAALHVCRDMRPLDHRCVLAMLGNLDAETFAINRYQTNGPAWFLEQDGEPVCIFGIELQHDAAGVAWLVCTPRMRSFKKLMRFSLKVAENAFSLAGMRRIEAFVLDEWAEAFRFAERLGMQHEGLRRKSGLAGESFHVFARVNQ